MTEYTWAQIRYMAGIDPSDPEFVQDVKFWDWLRGSKYQVISRDLAAQARESARALGVEILILKD